MNKRSLTAPARVVLVALWVFILARGATLSIWAWVRAWWPLTGRLWRLVWPWRRATLEERCLRNRIAYLRRNRTFSPPESWQSSVRQNSRGTVGLPSASSSASPGGSPAPPTE